MPVRGFDLRLPERSDVAVSGSAFGTIRSVVHLIEAPLVKGVLAQEVDRRQIKATTASGTPSRLEYGRLATKLVHFFPLGFGLASVALNESSILCIVSNPHT